MVILMKSPIKDRRFKNLSITHIKNLVPAGSHLNSYGLFSGDTELSLSISRNVTAVTAKPVIFNFWYCLVEDAEYIYSIVTDKSFKFHKGEYEVLQEKLTTFTDPFYRSALFFLLNRYSSTGQISCGEYDPSQYSAIALNYLRRFKKPENFIPHRAGSLMNHLHNNYSNCDYVLFPSLRFNYNLFDYGKSTGYDTEYYNHSKIREFLIAEHQKSILVYNYHPALQSFYKNFNIQPINKFGQPTENIQNCEEIIVTNF